MKILEFCFTFLALIEASYIGYFLAFNKCQYRKNQLFLMLLIILNVFLFLINLKKDLLFILEIKNDLYYIYTLIIYALVLAGYLIQKPRLDFAYMQKQTNLKEFLLYDGSCLVLSGCLIFLYSFACASLVAFCGKLIIECCLMLGGFILLVLFNKYQNEKNSFAVAQEQKTETMTYMSLIRSQRHDYNLHVQTIASLIKQEKWEESRKYVNALVDDTQMMNQILPIKNLAIAALINNYLILCRNDDIEFEIDIKDDLEKIKTSEYETNKVIGNLLQNALDETSLLMDKSYGIKLSILKKGEFILIKVSNKLHDLESFTNNQKTIFNQGFSTKKTHEGVGLNSIKMVLEKYGGNLYHYVEGDIVHFIANVPANLN